MPSIEEKIKGFLREQGVEVIGISGTERLDGRRRLIPLTRGKFIFNEKVDKYNGRKHLP